mgnify:CR=1 FL=1
MINLVREKNPMPEQAPDVRNKNFLEVCTGYTEEQAINEAMRCLRCRKKPCVSGCPVNIKIPDFIAKVAEGDFEAAYDIISEDSSLPAICGRVCPQETQCQGKCVHEVRGESVAIGRLERFVADWHAANFGDVEVAPVESNGHKVAIIGAGPAGMTAALYGLRAGKSCVLLECNSFGGQIVYSPRVENFPSLMQISGNELASNMLDQVTSLGADVEFAKATSIEDCGDYKKVLCEDGEVFEGKTVVISGSGNVATYANQKATQLGGKVVAMSDSSGYIYDPNGIDYKVIKQIKEVKRARISTYLDYVPEATFTPGCSGIWTVKCDIALPCATQNEINLDSANALIANGVKYVCEGANMPCTLDATKAFQDAGIPFGPAKAANAGGVATSGLEMSQNSQRLNWTFEEVDAKLQQIMKNIYAAAADAAAQVDMPGNLVVGANIAGFLKVADAMIWQGDAF